MRSFILVHVDPQSGQNWILLENYDSVDENGTSIAKVATIEDDDEASFAREVILQMNTNKDGIVMHFIHGMYVSSQLVFKEPDNVLFLMNRINWPEEDSMRGRMRESIEWISYDDIANAEVALRPESSDIITALQNDGYIPPIFDTKV